MKRMNNLLIATLFITLALSLISPSSPGVFGKESKLEPCGLLTPPDNSRPHYLEVWGTYSLPPAWGDFNFDQKEQPAFKLEA